jgi:hypothetical protein
MRRRKHPLSGAIYDVDEQGLVHVDDHGLTGVFTAKGEWVSGELHHVDPQLCGWLAGPQLPAGHAFNPKDTPAQKDLPTMVAAGASGRTA